MRQEKPLEAITLLPGALESINGCHLPGLRGNILNVLSEAYAKSQQPQACWRSIGLAERVLEYGEPVRERSHRLFDAAEVQAHKGIDALLLHDYQRAIALIDKSLATYNPALTPGRARLIARKAEAYYGLGEIDTCAAYAEETLMLARYFAASAQLLPHKNRHLVFDRAGRIEMLVNAPDLQAIAQVKLDSGIIYILRL